MLFAFGWPLKGMALNVSGMWEVFNTDYGAPCDDNTTDEDGSGDFDVLITGQDPDYTLIFVDFDNSSTGTASGNEIVMDDPISFTLNGDSFTFDNLTMVFSANEQSGTMTWDYTRDNGSVSCMGPASGDMERLGASAPDAFEPDNNPSMATIIIIDGSNPQSHNFHNAGDQDWVKFFGLAGQSYTALADNLEVAAAPVIELFDTNGTTFLESNDTINSSGEVVLDFSPAKNGIFFIRVRNSDSNIFGDRTGYELQLQQETTTDVDAKIQGVVLDAMSLDPIEDAVIWTSNNRSGLSEPDGDYEIPHPSGSYTLMAQASGFNTFEDDITIPEDGTLMKDILMETCTYSLDPTSQIFPASGGSDNVTVDTDDNCTWTAVVNDNATWITITSDDTGTGTGTFDYSVSANTSASPRTGTISVVDQTFTVTQNDATTPCVLGGSEAGSVVGGTISVSECDPIFTLFLDQTPDEEDVEGKLFVTVRTTEITLVEFLFARPADNMVPVNGSYVVLIKDRDGFLPGAEDYYYSEGALGGNDLAFEVGTNGLENFTVIFETWYLEGDDPNDLQLIQQVTALFVQ
jgi:hypothetical protein